MFCRQLSALISKILTVKKRLWKQTIWEIIVPAICGLLAGYISYTPKVDTHTNPLDYFNQISMTYLLSLSVVTLSFAGSCTFILNQIVVDKETKMRVSLKIMSASRLAYTLSYFLTQGCFVIFSALFVGGAFMYSQSSTYGHSTVGAGYDVLIGAVFFFGLALISLSMALTTLFSDSKLAPQVGMYLLLLPTSVYFYACTKHMQVIAPDTLGYKLFPLTYFMPHFSFSVIMLQFYIEGGPKYLMHLDVDFAWYCLIGATPFYILLYMYMDGIIPNAFGIRESLCFCFKCRRTPRNANWQD